STIVQRSTGTRCRAVAPNPHPGSSPFDRRVVFRRLGALVHAVIAPHLEDAEILRRRISKQSPPPVDSRLGVRPIDQVRELTLAIDALERVAPPFGLNRQPGAL